MNPEEEYIPSLLAGMTRYRRQVAVAVLACALLGVVYAWTSWSPQADMTVVVKVSSGLNSSNNVDADRATSEVAAQFSSPDVIAAAEDASGVTIDAVSATAAQGDSKVVVSVTSGSAEDANTAAEALLPAYEQVRLAATASQLQQQQSSLEASLTTVQDQLQDATLGAAERDILITREGQLQSDLDQLRVAAATPNAEVAIASGPDKGPGRLSLMLRYVPAGIVVGLLISMAVVAAVARRRPWLAEPSTAARMLRAPLLGVGPGPDATSDKGSAEVAPVAAMSILRAVGDTPVGIALLIPTGGPQVGDGVAVLARDMRAVLERAGAKVAVLGVAAYGVAFALAADGTEEEIDGLWSEFSGRAEFETKLQEFGIDADLVVLVPVVDIEHEVLLDLVLLADVTLVAAGTGGSIEPLIGLRRDFDALGRDPQGVLVDLSAR